MNNYTKNKHLRVLICYGSQNGYAESLASDINKSIPLIDKVFMPLNNVNINEMNSYDFIIFVVSTNKHGDFPDNAQLFYNNFNNTNSKFLFKYFLIGIGDTSYNDFCLPAKKIEIILSKTNTKKALDNIYLDDSIDHNQEYLSYKNSIVQILKDEASNIKKWFTKSMNTNLI